MLLGRGQQRAEMIQGDRNLSEQNGVVLTRSIMSAGQTANGLGRVRNVDLS